MDKINKNKYVTRDNNYITDEENSEKKNQFEIDFGEYYLGEQVKYNTIEKILSI